MKKYVAYYHRKTGNWKKKINIKNTYYRCDFFSFVSPSGDEYVQLVITKYTSISMQQKRSDL